MVVATSVGVSVLIVFLVFVVWAIAIKIQGPYQDGHNPTAGLMFMYFIYGLPISIAAGCVIGLVRAVS